MNYYVGLASSCQSSKIRKSSKNLWDPNIFCRWYCRCWFSGSPYSNHSCHWDVIKFLVQFCDMWFPDLLHWHGINNNTAYFSALFHLISHQVEKKIWIGWKNKFSKLFVKVLYVQKFWAKKGVAKIRILLVEYTLLVKEVQGFTVMLKKETKKQAYFYGK